MQDWIDVRRDIFLRFSEEQRFEAIGSTVVEGARDMGFRCTNMGYGCKDMGYGCKNVGYRCSTSDERKCL